MLPDIEPRRLVQLVIPAEIVGEWFKKWTTSQITIITEGPPADAKLVGMAIDPVRNNLHLTYEHPSFRLVPPGSPIPQADISVTSINPPLATNMDWFLAQRSGPADVVPQVIEG